MRSSASGGLGHLHPDGHNATITLEASAVMLRVQLEWASLYWGRSKLCLYIQGCGHHVGDWSVIKLVRRQPWDKALVGHTGLRDSKTSDYSASF